MRDLYRLFVGLGIGCMAAIAGLFRLLVAALSYLGFFVPGPDAPVPVPSTQFTLAVWCFCLAGIAFTVGVGVYHAIERVVPLTRVALVGGFGKEIGETISRYVLWLPLGLLYGLTAGFLADQSLTQFIGWLIPREAITLVAVVVAVTETVRGSRLAFESSDGDLKSAAEKQLFTHVPLLAGWLRARAVRALWCDGSPEAMSILARSGVNNGDKRVRTLALEALRQPTLLRREDDQASLQTIFDFWVESPDEELQRWLQDRLSLPKAPANLRALFLFLTEQWDRYETLDLDHSLLQASYEMGGESLRKRIADKARQAGRVEWVEAASGGRQGRRLADMTDHEWQSVLELLAGSDSLPEAWRLAQQSPPRWSSRLLARLRQSRWKPTGADQAGYAELQCLAKEWQDPVLGSPVQCRQILEGPERGLRYLAISPDGQWLVGGGGNLVRVWDLSTGQPVGTFGHSKGVTCLAISPDGQVLATGSYDQTVRLWRLPGGDLLQTLQGQEVARVHCAYRLAFSPDGRLLATGSSHNTVRLWGLPQGEPVQTLQGHTRVVTCLAISPDGRLLASGSEDQTVRLWGLPEGEPLRTLQGQPKDVSCLAISPDGQVLISGGRYEENTLRLWSLPNGEPLTRLCKSPREVQYLSVSPDGRLLVGGGGHQDKTVRLWGLPGGQLLRTLEGHTDEVWSSAISPDGRLLATGGDDKTVRLWSLSTGELLQTLEGDRLRVTCLAISPNGEVLASGGFDGTVRLWISQLNRLSRVPIGQMSQENLEWAQQTLREGQLSTAERQALEFIIALVLWRRRYDIQVEEGPRHIVVGKFDIEIDG